MPEAAPEFVQFGYRNTNIFQKQCQGLDTGLLGELLKIQNSLAEDPDPNRYPDRVTRIETNSFVYKNLDPPLTVMYRLDSKKKVIYFIYVDAPITLTRLKAMQAEAATAVAESPVVDPTEREEQRALKKVFISYSHQDEKYRGDLQKFFKLLQNQMDLWDDKRIEASDNWREEIKEALAAAQAAILLVSQDFLASEFISKNELPALLNRAKTEGLKIFWIAVRDCTYEDAPLEPYQALNDPKRPLERLSVPNRNSTFVEIYGKFKKKMEEV